MLQSEYVPVFVRIVLTSVILGLFLWMFTPFLTPIIMAALFGFGLDPYVSRFGLKKKRRTFPTLMILSAFFTVILIPLTVVVYKIVSLTRDLTAAGLEGPTSLQMFQKVLAKVNEVIQQAASSIGMDPSTLPSPVGLIAQVGAFLAGKIGDLASVGPEFVIDVLIFSLALYFFLTESKLIRRGVSRFRVISERELDQIIRIVQRTSYLTLVVSAIVGAVQATIVAIGALIFGYPEFMLIFVITFFISFVPVIGAGPVAFVLAILSLIQGEFGSAVGLGVVAAIAGSVDNILKPWIVSSTSEEDLNPVISTLAIIGAVLVYGIPGLLLGPILTELAFKIVPILFADEHAEELPPPITQEKIET